MIHWNMICWWFFLLVVAHVLSHDKSHSCIHDEIDHKLSQQHVKYKNHPLESADIQKRKLLQSSAYQPIRIRPYYDPSLINSYTLSDDQISYIKSLVSTSIHYLQQFVNVIPIKGPLLIDRCQRVFEYEHFTYGACPLSDYVHPVKCQYATIPESHIAESWYYDPLTLKSKLYKEAGSGITDADLVIYVSYSSGQCATDGSTLAWASICTLDQFGRPISGTINFCPGALDTHYWKFDVGVTLHEIMHILAMSNALFPYFYNWDSNTFYGESNVVVDSTASGFDNTYIVTERVKEISRSHFGCDLLIGAPLENTGAKGTIGSHWESKYLQSELMCGTMYSAVLYLSDFTVALMEDTGWYSMDYQYADTFTWGHNEGCAFFSADCVSKATSGSNFDQYWCTSATDNGCSYDYSTSGQCVNQLSGVIPTQFKYYRDAAFGGAQSHDYCAFRYPVANQMRPDYEHICWDTRGNTYSKTSQFPTVSFGINSRCVETSDGTNKNGYCFKHQCIQYDAVNARYNAVQMIISDGSIYNKEVITCARAQSLQWTESTIYSVHIKCPNIDSICGTNEKPFACYWGHYSSTLQKCICSVGYIGSECSIQDVNRLAIEAVSATTRDIVSISSPYASSTGICIADSIKSVINGYYSFDGTYEGLPSHHKEDGALYLYYLRYYAQWNIALSKGDLSIYAYCAEAISLNQYINIEACASWYVWDETNGWIHDVGVHLFYCKPTAAATTKQTVAIIAPTVLPATTSSTTSSKAPTILPVVTPALLPIDVPTIQPTDLPTELPTELPTIIPTVIPTEVPLSVPTTTPIVTTAAPTELPTEPPTKRPTRSPTRKPSILLTMNIPSRITSVNMNETDASYTTTDKSIRETTEDIQSTEDRTTQKPTNTPTQEMIEETRKETLKETLYNTSNSTIKTTLESIIETTEKNTMKTTEEEETYASTSTQAISPTSTPIVPPSTSPSKENTADVYDTTQLIALEEILVRKHSDAYDDNDSESGSYSFIVSALGCVAVGFALGFVCNRCIKRKTAGCFCTSSGWITSGFCPRSRQFTTISRQNHKVFNDSDGDEVEVDAYDVDAHTYDDYADSEIETDALNVYHYENPFEEDDDADENDLLHFSL